MDKPKLKKIIEKNLEGNYLLGASGKKELLTDILKWHKEQLSIHGSNRRELLMRFVEFGCTPQYWEQSKDLETKQVDVFLKSH